jgi:hypothetical protein
VLLLPLCLLVLEESIEIEFEEELGEDGRAVRLGRLQDSEEQQGVAAKLLCNVCQVGRAHRRRLDGVGRADRVLAAYLEGVTGLVTRVS